MAYSDNTASVQPSDPIATIGDMVREAEKHADDMAKDRIRAVEYYDGTMNDTPADKGRSQMVSRDLRAMVKKVLPSLMRTLFGSLNVVEYQPVGPGDENGAEQASDYINRVVAPEVDLRRHVEDAIHDALLLRNGVLRWWWEEKACARTSYHTGLTDEAFGILAGEDDVEVLQHTARQEIVEVPGPDGMPMQMPVQVHDVRIKRMETMRRPRVSCVPRERFLIHPDAVTLEDSILTGERMQVTRSDLIAMGYDYDTVMSISQAKEDDEEETTRRMQVLDADESHRPNQSVDYYDIFVRFDMDGDGIAELRHMCFAGGLTERHLLHDEECDEIQFCDIKVMSRPHQWEGMSLADDVMDIQRANTVLLRQTLDNIYWQNNPQPMMQDGAVMDEDPVYNPQFGKPIRVRQGVSVNEAFGFSQVPFVAQQSFAMMEYFDKEAQDRTGITEASAGMSPDALQGQTATATALLERQGIGQTEMMVRTAAEGLRKFFRGLLRLIVRHQDVARTVRLRDEWVEFDPRHWNEAMDCTVNVGLGAGTRERDMQVMQFVMGMQEKLIGAFGPDNPFVKPENVWEALSRSIEAAGLKTPEMYFTEPDPQEVAARMEAMKNQPSPEQIKAQTQMQIEQAKAQTQMQLEQAKMQAQMQIEDKRMQVQANKELAQMEADKIIEAERRRTDILMKDKDIAWEREKLLLEQRLTLATQGLAQGEDGRPVNQAADAVMAALQQTQSMLSMMADSLKSANMPKRVVRDMNGEVIGLEPVQVN